jgi:AraC-like DNA-binding protein
MRSRDPVPTHARTTHPRAREEASERLFVRLEDDVTQGPESAAPPGTLTVCTVPDTLKRHLAHVLVYRERIPAGTSVLERVLPDGAVRIVFNLAEPPTAGGAPGFAAGAIGASAAPALVQLSGRLEGLSITLAPGAARALLGVPASALEGTAVHLEELWGAEASRLLERLRSAPNDAVRNAALERALLERLRRSDAEPCSSARQAAALIAKSGGRIALTTVAERLGVGERRLQQLFREHLGLTPRTWGRIARLQQCLRLLRQQTSPRWAALAADAGFYDRAHLANEFRALSGLSPSAFHRQAISGSSKTPP